MIAISSDVDGMTLEAFREIHRYLNTDEQGPMGAGLGLDIADSMWVFTENVRPPAPLRMALVAGFGGGALQPHAGEMAAYVRAGWIDTLHTWGNYSRAAKTGAAFERPHALQAMTLLRNLGIRLPVWINHGNNQNRQNIGPEAWMEGDRPGSPAYHADLLPELGTQYLCFEHRAPVTEPVPLESRELNDGSRMWTFTRSACVAVDQPDRIARRYGVPATREGSIWAWHPQTLHLQISDANLDAMIENSAAVVIAQHLGFHSPLRRLNRETLDALANLARRARTGEILVARTSRLLDFVVARRHLQFESVTRDDRVIVDITAIECPVRGRIPPAPNLLRGITFEAAPGQAIELRLGGHPVPGPELFDEERDGVHRCGIRWFDRELENHGANLRDTVPARAIAPGPGAGTPGGRLAELNNRALAALDHPHQLAGAPGPELEKAIRYTRGRLRLGIGHYAPIIETLGFTGLQSVLDVGAGPGHWGLALAAIDDKATVTGIELRQEYVEIATSLARLLGLEQRLRFLQTAAEDMPSAKHAFNGAWCHSALMFTDHEQVVRSVSNSLASFSPFYCGYSTVGHHVNAAFNQFHRGNSARMPALLDNLLVAALYDCGIARSAGARRVISLFDLIQLAGIFGFVYRAEPDLEDGVRTFLGYPQTFDVLFGKRHDPDGEEQRLLAHKHIGLPEWTAELDVLTALGCPRLVLSVLERSGVDTTSRRIRPTLLRALLKGGQRERLKEATPGGLFSGLEPGLHGRIHHALGDYRRAETAYRKDRGDDPDAGFLKAMLRISTRSWRDAARNFDAILEEDPASLRARAGRLVCAAQSGDQNGLKSELVRWIESRSRFTTTEEIDTWLRNVDSAATSPQVQDAELD